MIRILCTGDSHTWGQGATGLLSEFDPPVVAGELRLASFRTNGYVNILRREVEKATDSYSKEWTAEEIAAISGAEFSKPCAVIQNKRFSFSFTGAMLRIQCRAGEKSAMPEVIIDDKLQDVFEVPAAQSDNDYRILAFVLEEGEHKVSIGAQQGSLLVYRVEAYGGSCAVMNGGVGSCAVQRYIEEYWCDRVENVKPDIVIAEAHTINDWLTEETPEEYYSHLVTMIDKYRSIGAKVVIMTVSPVLGEQMLNGNSAQYDDYIKMSRLAAKDSGITLCDANTIMQICLVGMDEKSAAEYLFDDYWHPNERGHALYAELIKQMILPMLEE